MKKPVLITIDVEEFDLPQDFGQTISEKEKYEISRKGLENLLHILAQQHVSATLFTTTQFALKYPKLMREAAQTHEIAFHGARHDEVYASMASKQIFESLSSGKKKIESATGKILKGFRSQRLQRVPFHVLSRTGIVYDSSLHPTYIPGRYNHFFSSRHIVQHTGMLEVPLSVTPLFRLPLFWLAFRNFGMQYAQFCTHWIRASSEYVMLLFHPWEFVDLHSYSLNIPSYIKRNTGAPLASLLSRYIQWNKRSGHQFMTVQQFLTARK